ncbi:MAG: DEAD/DEAH box helicase [Promethearchaeota archaeon]
MQSENPNFFNGSYLKKNMIQFRQYQSNIIKKCQDKNTLIVLPTGLGKTIIAVLVIAKVLEKYPNSKIIFLAPTRPLVKQHEKSLKAFLDMAPDQIISFTGAIPPKKRFLLFNTSQIIVSTPQIIKNDLSFERYDLKNVSLIIFDEAHRARGNYDYCFISKNYLQSCTDPQILALTASPGKDLDRIQQLCDELFIETVIFKSFDDEDVSRYIHDVDIIIEQISLPVEIIEISAVWASLFEKYLRFFIERKILPPNKPYYSKLDFLGISRDLTISLRYEGGILQEISDEDLNQLLYYNHPRIIDIVRENDLNIESIFSYCSSCISILHGKEILETQDPILFKNFLDGIKQKAEHEILAAKRIVNSEHYKYIMNKLNEDFISRISHPKISKIISIIHEEIDYYNNKKMLIFTKYRDMARFLKERLQEEFSDQLNIEKFIGQASRFNDQGFSQKKQGEIIELFRNGEINILISTSVAEEGLDIPNVDAIIFYEPIPSEIRFIQRRGRTGRSGPGRCYILLTRDTVDVPYHKVALRKQNEMMCVLSDPNQLELTKNIIRKPISINEFVNIISNEELMKTYEEQRAKENELLANKTIEDILSEIENFTNTDEYKKFKTYGITLISDLVEFDKERLKKSLLKIRGKKSSQIKERRPKINKNIKTLINLIRVYGNNGKELPFSKLIDYAKEEDIFEKKFWYYFNQACYSGYFKKVGDRVLLTMENE